MVVVNLQQIMLLFFNFFLEFFVCQGILGFCFSQKYKLKIQEHFQSW
jgi:hypothetical protein